MHKDVERILLSERTIQQRLDALAQELTDHYRCVGGELTALVLLHGSLLFAADLLRCIPIPLQLECLRVSSYHGGTESSGSVLFPPSWTPSFAERHLLVLDDILDTGRTLHAVCAQLQQLSAPPRTIKTCVLLRKNRPRSKPIDADFVGFDIGDAFVVGYGLDYRERYRNLPYVAVLKPEAIA